MKTYAGFWQRVAAFMWDYLIIVGYIVVITGVLWLVRAPEWLFINRVQSQVSGILVLTIPVTLYFAISESSARQATWGKTRQALTVADKNGNRIQFGKAFARAALKFAPWEIAHTLIWEISYFPETNPILINTGFALVYGLIGLNLASLLMTKTRQTIYDLITGTYIINNQKDQP
jgi:uncharacterized RDD family membrane protein YckC